MELDLRAYRRDCWLGALGALFMLAGDLCLSVIPASAGDSSLFLREAYLSAGDMSRGGCSCSICSSGRSFLC